MNKYKRDIVIRIVESNTGEILNEYRKPIICNFWHKKDKNDLHAYLDLFIEKIRSSSPGSSICIDFIADSPFYEGYLPF